MATTIEDVGNYGNLFIAHVNAKKGKTNYKSIIKFEENLSENLHKLSDEILSGTYRTSPYKTRTVNDTGKERIVSTVPYRDRIVHWAIIQQLEPVLLASFTPRTHAAIPGRGTHSALHQVRGYLLKHPEYTYCLKIDVKKYFQHINHEILKKKVQALTQCPRLRALLDENIDSFNPGTPIGNYTSQYWGNYYLADFDVWITSQGFPHTRNMDDSVILGTSSGILHELLFKIQERYADLGLSVKDNWQVFPVSARGIDFVGYRIYPNRVLMRQRTYRRCRRKLAAAKMRILKYGYVSNRDRSVISSCAGMIYHCTPKIRFGMYLKLLQPILALTCEADKFAKTLRRKFNDTSTHDRRSSGKPMG